MAGEADSASAASCAKTVSTVSAAAAISGAAGEGAAASVSAAGTNEWSSSPNSTSRPWRAAKAARSAGSRLFGGELVGALFDDGDLRIDQVADPPVIADFPQPPGDFPQHPRTLADRRQPLVQREAVERFHRQFLGRLDRTADGGERLGQALLRRCRRGDGLRGLLRRKAFLR